MNVSLDRSPSFTGSIAGSLCRAMAYLALSLTLTQPLPVLASEQLKVKITGLSGEPLLNTQASLSVLRQGEDESLTADAIHELHRRATDEIHRALQPFGYYRPEITAELQQPSDGVVTWRASYIIDAGPQVPIEHIDVQFKGPDADAGALATLSDEFPLRKEATLDHRSYEAAKSALLTQVRGQGYLDATYAERRVEVDLESYSASILLHVNTGPRYMFGPIVFEQQQFATDYLEQFLVLQPGEPFSQAAVSRQRNALSRSGHFQEVVVELGEPSGDEQPAIPLHISLVPYKANRYRGAVGWGTDTGVGLAADWTRRYLGRHGHHFNLGGAVVEERNRLVGALSYTIPLDPLTGHSIELTARHESKDLTFEDVELPEGGETRIATNLAAILWHRPDTVFGSFELEKTAGLSVAGETYDVFEVLFGNYPNWLQQELITAIGTDAYETLTPDFEAIVPSIHLTLRKMDDPLYIRRGDYFKLELLGTDEALGSSISFWQARLASWNIWPVGNSGRLLLRSALGYTDAESSTVLTVNFNEVPEYYEFRTGGARSVRGYGFETLIPDDTITGGKHMAVASIEYEHEIIPDWSAAVFLDGGNTFNDFDHIDEKLGAGVGIRWRSPVGLARIDLGFPLDDADDSFQIYITVGPEF